MSWSRTLRFAFATFVSALLSALPAKVYAQLASLASQSSQRVENELAEYFRQFKYYLETARAAAAIDTNQDSAIASAIPEVDFKPEDDPSDATGFDTRSELSVIAGPAPSTTPLKEATVVEGPNPVPAENLFRPLVLPAGTLPEGRTIPLADSESPHGASLVVNTALTFSRSEFESPLETSLYEELSLNLEPIFRHEGLGGITFHSDVRLVWRESESDGFFSSEDLDRFSVERGRTSLTKDFPASATRLEIGDVLTKPANFQTTEQLLGFRFGTAHREIHPFKTIYPGGRRTFQLDRRSRVQVYADGILVAQQVLEPGQFDLDRFATQYGTRNIELEVRDDTGQSVRLDFPTASSIQRLNKGVSDYSLAAGFAATSTLSGPEYDYGDFRAAGFYNLGVSNNITLGSDFQAYHNSAAIGARSVVATRLGALETRISASFGDKETDAAIGLRYASPFNPDSPRVNLSFEYFGDDYPDFQSMNRTLEGLGYVLQNPKYEADFAVSDRLSKNVTYSLGGVWKRNHIPEAGLPAWLREEQWSAYASSQVRLSNRWSTSLSVSANNYDVTEQASLSALLTIRRKFGDVSEADAAYASRRRSVSAGYRSDSFRTIDRTSWQVRADYAQDPQEAVSFSGDFDHTANRFNAYGSIFEDEELETETLIRDVFFQAETAFAFAGGEMAIGRPVRRTGFAIVKNDARNAKGSVYVDDWGKGDYRGRTSLIGNALISDLQPYANVELEISERTQSNAMIDESDPFAEAARILSEPVVYTYPYAGVVLHVTDGPNVLESSTGASEVDAASLPEIATEAKHGDVQLSAQS